ncbi:MULTISPECIES: hypothetical protein [Moorena]|nr:MULTISPECIES: hypothetical protein [Moorena]NEQ17852.1 hypothetical protein [Moorena sp. SIO3E2]NEP30487.1 hypothetical protein [Moorena sp. SIO3B2]NEP66010.1 hypothetical protein [Moorena sp. SIO3A5]NEQ09270.1 hypothetical protein [Moorena sp. SIO4E2]NER86751.1 hypothetical protein [Moorena sp. SIO3A2]
MLSTSRYAIGLRPRYAMLGTSRCANASTNHILNLPSIPDSRFPIP